MKKIENFIHGKIDSKAQNYLEVEDPSTGEVLGEVVLSDINDFNQTIVPIVLFHDRHVIV